VTDQKTPRPVPDNLICKSCGAMNKPYPAKPVIVREQDGSYSCTYCGSSFRLPGV
jgi:uncharacterized Zn-finger protein